MTSVRLAFVFAGLLGGAAASCTLLTNLDGFTCGAACDEQDATLDGLSPPSEASATDTSSPSMDAPLDGADASAAADADADAKDANVVDALAYTCPGAGKVADCASCAGGRFPCLLCGANGNDVTKLVGICVTSASSGSACQGKGPAGYDDCLCQAPSNPAPCPLPYQICVAQSGPACRTCGWDGGAGLSCKGGGVCSAAGTCL